MRGPHNLFRVGDKVKSFRGEDATVIEVEESKAWRSRSHRVTVEWDDKVKNPDKRSYYEEVFCSEGQPNIPLERDEPCL